ncbi:hypothetical protein IJG79_02750 [Candidatus Saccharibacteria bacterium]|nr:hypothetical protein [Candidatus Saccharibacteria bacterium]
MENNTEIKCPAGSLNFGKEAEYKISTVAQCNTDMQDNDLMGSMNTIINVVLGLIGFVAVVVIILGGVTYITSSGDTAKVTKAKNTILYGVIGLVIALLAFAIVNFVLSSIFK